MLKFDKIDSPNTQPLHFQYAHGLTETMLGTDLIGIELVNWKSLKPIAPIVDDGIHHCEIYNRKGDFYEDGLYFRWNNGTRGLIVLLFDIEEIESALSHYKKKTTIL